LPELFNILYMPEHNTDEKKEKGNQKTSTSSSATEDKNTKGASNLDAQILAIQDKLKKAQETFEELNKMKVDLEELKTKEEAKAREESEKEAQNISNLQKENQELKEKVSEYQKEMDGLKSVIGSLKSNVSKQAEEFQTRIMESLTVLEDSKVKNNLGHADTTPASVEVKKDSIEETKALLSSVKSEPVENSEKKEEATGESSVSIEEETKSTSSEEKTEKIATEANAQEKIPVNLVDSNADVMEEDFSDFDRIKQELLTLEKEASAIEISDDTTTATNTTAAGTADTAKEETPKEEAKDSIVNIDAEKPAEETTETTTANVVESTTDLKTETSKDKAPDTTSATASNNDVKPATIDTIATDIATTEDSGEISKQAEIKPANTPSATNSAPEKNKPKKGIVKKILALIISVFKLVLKLLALIFKKLKDRRSKKAESKKVVAATNEIEADKVEIKSGIPFIKAAVFLLAIFAAGFIYQIKNAKKTTDMYVAQIKGAQTVNNATQTDPYGMTASDPETRYKEAYTELPFDKTIWQVYKDTGYGITVTYPQNTSFRLKPIGSENVWFLRQNGYLMSIDRIEYDKSLDDFFAESLMSAKYGIEKIDIKGVPAIKLVLQEDLAVKGNYFIAKFNQHIYRIWYHTYLPGENPDDEKRVQEMLNSLEFISKDSSSSNPSSR